MRMYGDSFVTGSRTFVIVLWTGAVVAVQTPLGHYLIASGRLWWGFAMNACWAILFVGLTSWFLHAGAYGLAWARLLSYIANGIMLLVFCWTGLRERPARY
jgi:O-antigen/teichoic acid export membrane protein